MSNPPEANEHDSNSWQYAVHARNKIEAAKETQGLTTAQMEAYVKSCRAQSQTHALVSMAFSLERIAEALETMVNREAGQ